MRRIVGHFIPSGRNELVRDHYGRMGFRKDRGCADLDTWDLALLDYVPRNPPILLVRPTPHGGVP
jgi:predicted enzyme involved in methoxymalonyl-ACP biosynthesis